VRSGIDHTMSQTGTLPIKDNSNPSDSAAVADEYATLAKLLVLAEKLMDEQAKAAVLAAISARSKEPFSDGNLYYPAIDSVQIIYEGTSEDSPARALLVEMYTESVTSAFVTDKSDAVPKDFLQDLALSLLVNRPLLKIHDKLKSEFESTKCQLLNTKRVLADTEEALRKAQPNNSSLFTASLPNSLTQHRNGSPSPFVPMLSRSRGLPS